MGFTYIERNNNAKIKVIGVGGAGGNAVNNMIAAKLAGVDFIIANTDTRPLRNSMVPVSIQLGEKITGGLGAGAIPEVGRASAEESIQTIKAAVSESHMVFITAGFGGGTGTGAAPVIARACRELGALTVAVVSKPFSFEGKKRVRQADEGIQSMKEIADAVITIPNDRLRSIASKNDRMVDMFRRADDILLHSVKGITDLVKMTGHVNLDFADVRATMEKAGGAIMGFGVGSGENRAIEAVEQAISHPLLEDISMSGARGVLLNITSDSDITMDEMTLVTDRIHQEAGEDADIIWGQVFDQNLKDKIQVTVIATGIRSTPSPD